MARPNEELRRHDLGWCLRRCPKRVLEALKASPGRVMVSGGFIRDCVSGDKINDVDLFVSAKEGARELATRLAGENKIHETENAYTISRGLGLTVQVIHRWIFDSPERLVDSFDFTIAKAAFWWEGNDEKGAWESTCHPDFYADLAARRLVYVGPEREEEPGGSLLRVLKFYQRGYQIPLDSLGWVIARLVRQVNFQEINSRRDLVNRERKLARVLTGLLREVDPNVDPNHIAHLPSEPEQELEED
jgi:hypothetical protein